MGNRLESQFEFDNFIPSIITLTMEHVVDIYNEEKYIVIALNETEVENDRNNKFSYVKEYFNELKHIERLKKDLQIVKEDASKADLEYKSAVDQLDLTYAKNTDSQKQSSEKKQVSSTDQLMHEPVHKMFHPSPKRARYSKRNPSYIYNFLKLVNNWIKRFTK